MPVYEKRTSKRELLASAFERIIYILGIIKDIKFYITGNELVTDG